MARPPAEQWWAMDERFWSRVDASGDCWEWLGAKDVNGYGDFEVNPRPHRKRTKAHRFGWELLVGPIPDGLEIDHLCRNHGCVNPDHLEPVTHAENLRRGVSPLGRVKNVCAYGHQMSDSYQRPDGQRDCRLCKNRRQREYTQRQKGVVHG